MSTCSKILAALLSIGALAGCDEVVVGEWQSLDAFCDGKAHDQLTIESDLTGTATIVLDCAQSADGELSPIACPAVLAIFESQQEEQWDLEADFGYCEAAGGEVGRRFKDCTEQADGDKLRCCDPKGSRCISYVRAD